MTRRDAAVAVVAIVATLCISALVKSQSAQPTLMRSSIFEWSTIAARTTKTGAVRQFFQAPTATLDELECHVTTLAPGASPHAPHSHPDEELIVVKEGTVESLVGGELKKVGPGSVIFQASNQTHAIKNVGDVPATYHVIRWNSPGMLKKKTAEGK